MKHTKVGYKIISQREAKRWRALAKKLQIEVNQLRRGFDEEIEGHWLPWRAGVAEEVSSQLRVAQLLGFGVEAEFRAAEKTVAFKAVRRNRGKA